MTSCQWIYISPHLDDAVFSCGGIIWQQIQSGCQVEIWSIFSGDPPRGELTPFAASLHARWGIKVPSLAERRVEDLTAVSRLGAIPRHLNYPECIYRRLPGNGQPLVSSEEDLWQPLHKDEISFMYELGTQLSAQIPENANLVCPLAIGGHVDHRLVHAASQHLRPPLYFYPDFPYAAGHEDEIQAVVQPGWHSQQYEISPQALTAWQDGVAAYNSQFSTFWRDIDDMRQSLAGYLEEGGGRTLWLASDGVEKPEK